MKHFDHAQAHITTLRLAHVQEARNANKKNTASGAQKPGSNSQTVCCLPRLQLPRLHRPHRSAANDARNSRSLRDIAPPQRRKNAKGFERTTPFNTKNKGAKSDQVSFFAVERQSMTPIFTYLTTTIQYSQALTPHHRRYALLYTASKKL